MEAPESYESAAEPKPPVSEHRRNPWGAALLSLIAPGTGQLYAGRPGRAFSALLAAVASRLLLLLVVFQVAAHPLNIILWGILLAVVLVALPVAAAIAAARASRPYQLQPYNRWFIYLAFGFTCRIAMFLAGAAPLGHFVIEAFRNPTGSMEPTLLVGDFFYVDRTPAAGTSIGREDIVTYRAIEEPSIKIIKRIVGLPGDTLAMVSGTLFRNGDRVAESYVKHTDTGKSEDELQRAKMRAWQIRSLVGDSTGYAPDLQTWGPVVVPEKSYFALGDNREASYDSRYYGFIPAENIVGQLQMIYWSYDRSSFRPLPFLSAVRWERLGRTFRGMDHRGH